MPHFQYFRKRPTKQHSNQTKIGEVFLSWDVNPLSPHKILLDARKETNNAGRFFTGAVKKIPPEKKGKRTTSKNVSTPTWTSEFPIKIEDGCYFTNRTTRFGTRRKDRFEAQHKMPGFSLTPCSLQ